LRTALAAHRKRQPQGEYVFSGERCHRPLNLANLVRREIKPALDKAGIKWQGWHAFRRGVSSTLNAMGVDDSVIQQIVRHGDVQTTQRHYIKTTSKQAQDAMTLLASAATKALKQAKGRRPRKK
jgi:integrase